MIRKHHLVIGQLENISWEVIEKYRPIIKDMIRGKSGIYALYNNGELYYVGLATNLMGRLKTHLKDRHIGKWNTFSVYLTRKDEHMKELESLFLRILKPPGNKVKGKFKISTNLRVELNRQIRTTFKEKQAYLMGGVAITRRRENIKVSAKGKGAAVLAGLVSKRMVLCGKYKGYYYFAKLYKNGKINLNGYLYDSPTAAAREVAGRSVSGWGFWKYRDDTGEWVRLRNIRK